MCTAQDKSKQKVLNAVSDSDSDSSDSDEGIPEVRTNLLSNNILNIGVPSVSSAVKFATRTGESSSDDSDSETDIDKPTTPSNRAEILRYKQQLPKVRETNEETYNGSKESGNNEIQFSESLLSSEPVKTENTEINSSSRGCRRVDLADIGSHYVREQCPKFTIPNESKVWVVQIPHDIEAKDLIGLQLPKDLEERSGIIGGPDAKFEVQKSFNVNQSGSLSCMFSNGMSGFYLDTVHYSAFLQLSRAKSDSLHISPRCPWKNSNTPLKLEELLPESNSKWESKHKSIMQRTKELSKKMKKRKREQNEEETTENELSKKKKKRKREQNEEETTENVDEMKYPKKRKKIEGSIEPIRNIPQLYSSHLGCVQNAHEESRGNDSEAEYNISKETNEAHKKDKKNKKHKKDKKHKRDKHDKSGDKSSLEMLVGNLSCSVDIKNEILSQRSESIGEVKSKKKKNRKSNESSFVSEEENTRQIPNGHDADTLTKRKKRDKNVSEHSLVGNIPFNIKEEILSQILSQKNRNKESNESSFASEENFRQTPNRDDTDSPTQKKKKEKNLSEDSLIGNIPFNIKEEILSQTLSQKSKNKESIESSFVSGENSRQTPNGGDADSPTKKKKKEKNVSELSLVGNIPFNIKEEILSQRIGVSECETEKKEGSSQSEDNLSQERRKKKKSKNKETEDTDGVASLCKDNSISEENMGSKEKMKEINYTTFQHPEILPVKSNNTEQPMMFDLNKSLKHELPTDSEMSQCSNSPGKKRRKSVFQDLDESHSELTFLEKMFLTQRAPEDR